jgi:competence protein ComEA
MNKHRIFLASVVALAAAAAVLRAQPSAPSAGGPSTTAPSTSSGAFAQDDKVVASRVVVYVAGAVARPGVYRLPPGRVDAAVKAAGGLSARADAVAVNLAEPLRDGEEIVVPLIGAEPAARAAACTPHRRKSARSGSRYSESRARRSPAKSEPTGTIDLNRASAEELETLPGIGPHLAERIVQFRDRNGPFATLDEFSDVNGVSPKILDGIASLVIVTGR